MKKPSFDPTARKHAHLAPSAAHRWMRCPGSVALCKTIEEPKVNEYAAEGTVFHRVMKLCLLHGLEPPDFEGLILEADGYKIEVDEAMVDHAIASLDRCLDIGHPLHVETRVSLERWIPKDIDPDTGGTLDIGHAGKEWITILDHKYGTGIAVSPFRNEQTMSYGLGYWDQIARHITDARKFRFIINQPRNPAGGGEWECDIDDLLRFGKKLARAAIRTTEKNAPLIPGHIQCDWCPARARCPAYDEFTLDAMALKFDNLDLGKEKPPLLDASQMTPGRRAYVLRHRKFIEMWLEDVHNFVMDQAMQGTPGIGYKVIAGRRPHSKWTDREKVEKFLLKYLPHKEVFVYKLISPAQATKKKLKPEIDEVLQEYIDRGEPKPILVPEDDPRPALTAIDDKFENLDD